MPLLPTLKDQTGHPYTNGHLWLCLTILLSVLTLPPIVVFNIITQGSELVPWLQPTFNPDNTNLEHWWGTRYLPKRLRPALPQCQPQEVGRGDIFQLSASMFVYTVMGTWNTSHSPIEDQGQNRVGYRGESFANCSVANALYDYSLSERTHSVTVGVRCPGYDDYSVALSMQTTMTFASETTKSFIGQYYGPGLDLLDLTKTTNYRQTVLAVLDVISTDALSILSRQHLPVAPLRMRVYFDDITDTEALLPDQTTTSSITYVNGSQTNNMPAEGFIYTNTMFNLVYVAMDAVNLDLGNSKPPNMFRNFTRFTEVVFRNQALPGINSTDWAEDGQSVYYGRITPPYQTWADMLRNQQPSNITIGHPTGLPKESVMVTSYLCQNYQIKPLKSLLSSVFVGSVAMAWTAWSGWLLLVAFLAEGQVEPRAKCRCEDCLRREWEDEQERSRKATNVGLIRRILAPFKRAKHTTSSRGSDLVQPPLPSLAHRHVSDQSDSLAKGE